ncbi:MAG: zinc ribbon domain-containing protein [Bacillales bacterium]|jgi:Zn finger protein HypA/HybF involved in hydrogenase expression|nr:zinc ribbon domain-containing protein [Bacillales bacterium]
MEFYTISMLMIIPFVFVFIFTLIRIFKNFNRTSKIIKEERTIIKEESKPSYCRYCGAEIPLNENKCSSCGASKIKNNL